MSHYLKVERLREQKRLNIGLFLEGNQKEEQMSGKRLSRIYDTYEK